MYFLTVTTIFVYLDLKKLIETKIAFDEEVLYLSSSMLPFQTSPFVVTLFQPGSNDCWQSLSTFLSLSERLHFQVPTTVDLESLTV